MGFNKNPLNLPLRKGEAGKGNAPARMPVAREESGENGVTAYLTVYLSHVTLVISAGEKAGCAGIEHLFSARDRHDFG